MALSPSSLRSSGAQGARILYVDDDPLVLKVFERTVRDAGWTVDLARDASTALALAKEHSYAIILADQQMPDITGQELIAMLKERQPTASYIVVTAHSELAVAASKKPGFFVVLSKPWDRDTLLSILAASQTKSGERRLH